MGKMQEKVERGFGRIRGLAKLTNGDEKAVGRDLRNSYHPFFVWLGVSTYLPLPLALLALQARLQSPPHL